MKLYIIINMDTREFVYFRTLEGLNHHLTINSGIEYQNTEPMVLEVNDITTSEIVSEVMLTSHITYKVL